MYKEDEKETRDERKGAQYGKKGRKPRNNFVRPKFDLDKVETNNIAYWNKTANYVNVTKFPWSTIIGNPVSLSGIVGDKEIAVDLNSDMTFNPAQIMAIDFVAGPGWAADTNDGVNRALAMLMSRMRASLSTSNFGFETADLGILMAATSSIAMMIGYAKSTLEAINVWKDRNFAWPRALIKAKGFDYNDIIANKPHYYATLKSIIDRYNALRLIDISDVYDRQYVMVHNVYVDESSDLAQMYIFRPRNFYIYKDDEVPSHAQNVPITWGNYTFGEYLQFINNALDSWYNSSDFYLINGVMHRAFKDAPVQNIPQITEDDVVEPSTDREHLMQVMNSTIVPLAFEDAYIDTLNITQDPTTQNYVVWKPQVKQVPDGATIRSATLLRIFEDDISPDDNMEMTRLLNMWDASTSFGDLTAPLTNCGSEIVVGITVYKYNAVTDSITTYPCTSNHIVVQTNNSDPGEELASVELQSAIAPFRYIPTFYLWHMYNGMAQFTGILGDQYNWMVYPIQDWKNLQFTAYQSFWTPKV